MIDFNKVNAPVNVDTGFIMSRLDEVQIFYYYFGNFKLGNIYPSKFRKDSNPSTGFYINRSGKLIYNDLKTGEKLNCFTFVAKLYNTDFVGAINRIATDFGLIDPKTAIVTQEVINSSIHFDTEYKKDTLIQFEPGKWSKNRLKYWFSYEISQQELVREEIYPVDRLFINKREITRLDELCFAYIVRDKDKIYIKIYSPFSESMKWLSNIPLTIPFGLNTLKVSDRIEIGKAQKDRLILMKFFKSVIGTQNESESALPPELVKHILKHFPQRTIIWDADETGVTNCTKFNEKGFGYFNTPKQLLDLGIKDVSDYVKHFGLNSLEKLFKQKGLL